MKNPVFGFLRPTSSPVVRPLRGNRVYLRQPRTEDWRGWAEVRSASRAFLEPWEPRWPKDALSRAAFRRRLRRQERDRREDSGYSFFIFRRSDDELLGGMTLSNVQRGITMSCNLGYWIGVQHARQGLMTEAVRCVLPFVFETLGLNRLEAACLPNNVASRRLLEGLGFVEEGYARGYLRINGEWHDHVLFAILSQDYFASAC